MMRKTWMAVLALVVASPAAGQQAAAAGGSVAGVRGLYTTVKGYITSAADQMPEADYAFKPTPEVRSFGQLIGHVSNASYLFCAYALGETAPQMPNAEELTTKAELVAALQAAFAYCDRAYQLSDAASSEPVEIFGQPHTKLSALAFNMGHDFEHYGNIVTYMRLKGMVPPSSQRTGN